MLEAALQQTAARHAAEVAAAQSRVERAGDAAGAAGSSAPAAPVSPPGAPAVTAEALESLIDTLGPEQVTALGVVVMDVIVVRLFGPKAELTASEREKIAIAAVPVLKLYLPQLKVHPLTALGAVVLAIYGSKALPEGVGLAALLGGGAKGPAPEGQPDARAAEIAATPPVDHS